MTEEIIDLTIDEFIEGFNKAIKDSIGEGYKIHILKTLDDKDVDREPSVGYFIHVTDYNHSNTILYNGIIIAHRLSKPLLEGVIEDTKIFHDNLLIVQTKLYKELKESLLNYYSK